MAEVEVKRPPPVPPPEPITAAVLSANIAYLGQIASPEVWVSSDEED